MNAEPDPPTRDKHTEDRIAALERLYALERREDEFVRRLDKLESGLHANNDLTNRLDVGLTETNKVIHQVKTDTTKIVELFKTSETATRFLIKLIGVIGSILVAWAAYRGLTK